MLFIRTTQVVSSSILGIRLINTIEERIELLEQQVESFSHHRLPEAFANQPPRRISGDFLIKNFTPLLL